MDVMVARLNGIMAQVLRKGLTEGRRTGIMVPVPLKGLMADLLPGVKAQDLLPMREVALLTGVTGQVQLLARVVAQHPGAGKRLMEFCRRLVPVLDPGLKIISEISCKSNLVKLTIYFNPPQGNDYIGFASFQVLHFKSCRNSYAI
jgi:hypothetical protein